MNIITSIFTDSFTHLMHLADLVSSLFGGLRERDQTQKQKQWMCPLVSNTKLAPVLCAFRGEETGYSTGTVTGRRLQEEFCGASTVLIFYLGADYTSLFNTGAGAIIFVLLFGCYSSMQNLKRWMGGWRQEKVNR